jgi:hypothetical protein
MNDLHPEKFSSGGIGQPRIDDSEVIPTMFRLQDILVRSLLDEDVPVSGVAELVAKMQISGGSGVHAS